MYVSGHVPAVVEAGASTRRPALQDAAVGGPTSAMAGRGSPCRCSAPLAGIPSGAWDSHMHVTDPERFPPLPDAEYRPGVYTVRDNAAFEHDIGCEHVVLVQPSIYGSDNSLLLEALRAYGPHRARGVVVLDAADACSAPLRAWHVLGVRGVRLNLHSRCSPAAAAGLGDALCSFAAALRPLGWLLDLYAPMDVIPSLEPLIPSLGVRVVFDHLGDPTLPPSTPDPQQLDPYTLPGFGSLVRLLRAGSTWVKVSAAYRFSRLPGPTWADLDPVIRELLRVAPSRLVYASDWPHTRFEGLDIRPWTKHLLSLTDGNDELRRKLFRDNARELWSFESPCSEGGLDSTG